MENVKQGKKLSLTRNYCDWQRLQIIMSDTTAH